MSKFGPLTQATDAELVQMCLAGDQRAWSALIDRYAKLIYSVPASYRIPPQDAADIFQVVCIELHSALPRLRETVALRKWLLTVASHECYRWKRRLSRVQQHSAETDENIPDELSEGQARQFEKAQILHQAIGELPPRCREMVRLLFFHDPPLPYAEVAQKLGLALGSIGFIRGRCLTKLRQALERLRF